MSARVHLQRYETGHHVAAIDIPTTCGAVRVTGVGGWFSDALSVASSVAKQITSDPVMSAILPPQASMAINAVRQLSNAAQQGAPALRAAMTQFTGPGTRRLAKVLHTEAQRRGVPSPLAMRPPPMRRGEVPERAQQEQQAEQEYADANQGDDGDDGYTEEG